MKNLRVCLSTYVFFFLTTLLFPLYLQAQERQASSPLLGYDLSFSKGLSSLNQKKYPQAIAELKKALKAWAAKPSPESNGKILMVDVLNDKLAVAKIKLKWNKNEYYDYVTLAKINNKWKIVSKIFMSKKKLRGGYGG